MKRIIDGISYDTDAATELARGDHGHEASQAWWALYKKRDGTFFEIAADHDGAIEDFRPLSRRQARVFLERTANHLVEEHFGPMPETRIDRFSRATRIAAVEVLECSLGGHSEITRAFLKINSDLALRCDSGSIKDRFNNLIKFLDEDDSRTAESGELVQDVVVDLAASTIGARPYWNEQATAIHDVFRRALDRDGFVLGVGSLRRALPPDLALPQAQDEIERLLDKHGFATLAGHLSQATDAHSRGQWASANAQLRTFYEGLFDDIAVRLDPTAATLQSSENRRAKLGQIGFLDVNANEWSGNGKNFINGLFKRLHPSGSHPGLSDQEDSTFRRHVVLLTAKLILSRFDNWPP